MKVRGMTLLVLGLVCVCGSVKAQALRELSVIAGNETMAVTAEVDENGKET